jgi:hypothetical protein
LNGVGVPVGDQSAIVRQDRLTIYDQRAIRVRLGGKSDHRQSVVRRLRLGLDATIRLKLRGRTANEKMRKLRAQASNM